MRVGDTIRSCPRLQDLYIAPGLVGSCSPNSVNRLLQQFHFSYIRAPEDCGSDEVDDDHGRAVYWRYSREEIPGLL